MNFVTWVEFYKTTHRKVSNSNFYNISNILMIIVLRFLGSTKAMTMAIWELNWKKSDDLIRVDYIKVLRTISSQVHEREHKQGADLNIQAGIANWSRRSSLDAKVVGTD